MYIDELIEKYKAEKEKLFDTIKRAKQERQNRWLELFEDNYKLRIAVITDFITDLEQLSTESKKGTEEAAKNNPDNRYLVTIKDYDKEEQLQCYLYDNEYRDMTGQEIHRDWIVSVEKIK